MLVSVDVIVESGGKALLGADPSVDPVAAHLQGFRDSGVLLGEGVDAGGHKYLLDLFFDDLALALSVEIISPSLLH